jgi:hypothetical protein
MWATFTPIEAINTHGQHRRGAYMGMVGRQLAPKRRLR